jgi:uncharacterized protein (TIGR02145 family)
MNFLTDGIGHMIDLMIKFKKPLHMKKLKNFNWVKIGKLTIFSTLLLMFYSHIVMGQVPANIGNKSIPTTPYDSRVEELKVRWKKAALENCTGVPCIIAPPAPSFTCGTSTISDIDNNSYNTVLIGTQCWTKENLKVTKYNDGTLIPDSTNSTWGTAEIGARTGYIGVGTPAGGYVGTYGYLYNWYAVNDAKGLCPDGWHVPTDADWTDLEILLGGSSIAGTKLRSKSTLWNTSSPPSPGTDNYGFSAIPGGYRHWNSTFSNIGYDTYLWSATQLDSVNAWYRLLWYDDPWVGRSATDKKWGASVRCLRD